MNNPLTPQILMLASLAGWLNREQQRVLDYLREENRVLKEQLGKRRLRLTDEQRRRLAAKGWEMGRRLLGEFATIVTPDDPPLAPQAHRQEVDLRVEEPRTPWHHEGD